MKKSPKDSLTKKANHIFLGVPVLLPDGMCALQASNYWILAELQHLPAYKED